MKNLYLFSYVFLWVVTNTETEEGIAHAIVKGELDFTKQPWPRISGNAKDLVKGMLEQNPYSRLTVQEVLGNSRMPL